MATQSELNYLRNSLAKRRESQSTGSVNYQNGDSLSNPENEVQPEKEYNWIETAKGWWDNLGTSMTRGLFSAVEGIVDFGAMIAAGVGDFTGWYDTEGIKDFAKKDFSGDIAEWTRDNFAYYNPLSIDFWVNTANGQLNAENYQKSVQSLGEVFNPNADYSTSQNKVDYNYQTEFNGGINDFIFGLAESGAAMVPSIALGGLGATSAASKALSLGTMGLSVAGNESTEALREGNDVGTSLLYGGVKGGIEVGTELLTGKVLNGLAKLTGLDKAIGKFSGNVGGWNFAKEVVGKAGVKEIGKDIIEEGAEEVFSEILDPFAKAILGGGADQYFERLGKNLSEKEWAKDLATSFLSGAVLGGFSSLSSRYQLRRAIGADGINILDEGRAIGEQAEQARQDFQKGKITADELGAIQEELGARAQEIVKGIDGLSPQYQENVLRLLAGEQGFSDTIFDANNHVLKESDNVYTLESNETNRLYTITEEGNEAIYSTPSNDFFVAMDNFTSENIPADSVMVSSTPSNYATITESSYRNLIDDGVTKEEIKKVGDSITKGEYEVISTDNGKVTAYSEIDGQGYEYTFNEKGKVKRITGVKRKSYTKEQINLAQAKFYSQIATRDFKASMRTLNLASRGKVIALSDVKKYLSSMAKVIRNYSFAKHGEIFSANGNFTIFGSMDELSRKLAATVDLGTDVETILATMNQFTDEAIEAGGLYERLSVLGEEEARKVIDGFKKELHSMNEKLLETKAVESDYSRLMKSLFKRIDSLVSKLGESNAKHKLIDKTRKSIDRIKAKFTNESTHTIEFETSDAGVKFAHQGEIMFAPWINAKMMAHGLDYRSFSEELNKLYELYTSDSSEEVPNPFKEGTEGFGYVEEIERKMASLLEILDEHARTNQRKEYSMTAFEMQLAEELRMAIERRYNKAKKMNHEARIRSFQAEAETTNSKKGATVPMGRIKKFFFEFDSLINDPKVAIRNMTGSELISDMCQDIWAANISSLAYQQKKGEEIDNLLKKVFEGKGKFRKVWDAETSYEYKGRKLKYSEAFWWYAQLTSKNKENVNEARRGFHTEGENGNDFYYEYQKAQEPKDGKPLVLPTEVLLKSALDEIDVKYKGEPFNEILLEFLVDNYNGELRDMYREMSKEKLGGGLDSNTIEGNEMYFPKTVYTPRGGTGRGKMTEVRPFLNMKTRVSKGGTRGIRYVDAIEYFKGYVGDLANEYMVRPKTDALSRTIDVRTDAKGIHSYGNNVLTPEQFAIIDQWIKQVTGAIKPMSSGKIAGAVVTYTLQTPKTALMQGGSYYVSGIKLSTMLRHAAQINAFADTPQSKMTGQIADAYQMLLESNPEFGVRKKINSVYKAYTNRDVESPIGKFMTAGIGLVDNLTLKKIALASIYEARDNVAMRRGVSSSSIALTDSEVITDASYIARQSYQTQISSLSSDRSFLRYGVVPFGKKFWDSGLGKNSIGLLRMYGGAAQGFYSYMSRTFGDFAKYHNFKLAEYEGRLAKAKETSQQKTDAFKKLESDIATKEEQLADIRYVINEGGLNEEELAKARGIRDGLKKEIKELKSTWEKTQREMLQADGEQRAIESEIKGYKNYVKFGGGKGAIGRSLGGALAMGIFTTLITNLFAWIKDKDYFKDRKDEDEQYKYLTDIVLNSSVNMIPIMRTFASILQGYEVEEPGMSAIKNVLDVFTTLNGVIRGEKSYKTLVRQFLEIGSMFIGFNASAWGKYIYGIVERFSPEACLKFKSVFYDINTSFSEISSYAKDNKMGAVNFLISENAKSSVGTLPPSVQSEMTVLAKEGLNALPTAVSYSFNDADGNAIPLSDSDRSKIKQAYARANQEAKQLVASVYYKKLTSEQKAKALKSLYQNFKVSAANQVNEAFYSSSLSKVSRLISGGVKDIGKILSVVAYLNSIEPKKGKTRKETLLSEIKKTNLNSSQRIIALYLAGVSVEDSSLKNALIRCGVKAKDAEEIV